MDREDSVQEPAVSQELRIREPRPKVETGMHHMFTHFPKDQNREVCRRTKISRAPCRQRTSNPVPRAEKFGDLNSLDNNVLNEDGKSCNSYGYAAVVQDLGTQWLQAYPCKTKTSQETKKCLKKYFEPKASPKVIFRQLTGIWGRRVKIYRGIIVPPHLTDMKQMVLQNREYVE